MSEDQYIDPTSTAVFGAISFNEDVKFIPLSAEDKIAVEALPAGSALLIVQKGSTAGSRFLLNSEVVTVGRWPDSDIFLDDVTVSRRHAEFVACENGFLVRDVGSLNGTYVNHEQINSKVLTSGDEVQIGKYKLTYYASVKGE